MGEHITIERIGTATKDVGNIDIKGFDIDRSVRKKDGIQPALQADISAAGLQIDDLVYMFGYIWTVISDNHIRCDETIDPYEYEGTDLKERLENWYKINIDWYKLNSGDEKKNLVYIEKLITVTEDIEKDIQGITLLSVEEAKGLSNSTSTRCEQPWWLRSAEVVDGSNGYIYDIGNSVYEELGVRPALQIEFSPDLYFGDQVRVFDRFWTVVSHDCLLCDTIIGQAPFRKDGQAQNAKDYEASDIKKWLEDWFQKNLNKEKENKEMAQKVVKLNDIAAEIGNEPKEVTLPNGMTRMSINWDGPTARAAVAKTTPLASGQDMVVFDGPAPGWFASALAHSVHPSAVGLNDPKIGVVPIPSLAKGEPNPDCGVEFAVTEGKDFVRLDWQLTDPVFDVANLPKIVLPEINTAGKDLVVGGGTDVLPNSGKGPNYIAVSIGEAYAHTSKSVSYFQPQTQGYTVGITHVPGRQIGDLIPKTEVDKDISEYAKEKATEQLKSTSLKDRTRQAVEAAAATKTTDAPAKDAPDHDAK